MEEKKTKSYASPRGKKKACLCADGTYSKECCNQEVINQGIGSFIGQSNAEIIHTITPRIITHTSN